MEEICEAIYKVLAESRPQTVRHVFYAITTRYGLIPKTEAGYATIKRKLLELRRSGRVPFSWVSDNTRWMRKPRSFDSLREALEHTARTYRRDLWRRSPAYVEIWCESDSIAGVLIEETARYDTPLMVARGFASATFLYSAAQTIQEIGKPAFLYYFGDYDPSGRLIPEVIERDLRKFAPNCEIHFETVAVTSAQIEKWSLPTKPPKRSTHARTFRDNRTVEIEAIPADVLRGLVTGCIEQHLDQHELKVLRAAEASERDTLWQFIHEIEDA